MSASGFTPISIYYSSTASNVPTAANLVPGELAINTNDGKLYYEDSSGVVRVLASKSTGSIGGSNTQVQFNSSGSLGGSSGLTWDGSFLTTSSIKNSALTSGRVTYAGASGLLSDSANLTYNGTGLGIGGTSATAKLQINVANVSTLGSPTSSGLSIDSNDNNIVVGNISQISLGLRNSYQPSYISYVVTSAAGYSNGDLTFGTRSVTTDTAPTERMRLTSGGSLLVGTTTNPNGIISRVKGGNGDSFEMDNDGSQFTSFYLSNNGTIKVSSYWDNTNLRYQIVPVTNGVYLSSGGVAWIAVSDERQKDIIEPITNATNKISQLRTVIGKYKTDPEGTRRSFLIAQDVQFVLPEAVDATNPNELGLSYTDTIPLLVAAIKEQQALIESLTTRLSALENK